MGRSERGWARTLARRGLVAATVVLVLAAYGLVSSGTQTLTVRPAATATSTAGGHSVAQAVSPSNGSINLATQGPSHTLYFYWELKSQSGPQYTGVWNGPLGIGAPGSTFSAPSIVAQFSTGPGSAGYGNFDIAVEGSNHTGDLYWDISGTWYGPYQFAGPGMVFSSPAMVEDSRGNLQITAQGPSNTLYAYWNTMGTFYGPLGIGGPNSTFSGPSMGQSGDETTAIVQGRNHDLEWYYVDDGSSNPANATPWSAASDFSNDGTAFDAPNVPLSDTDYAIFEGPNNALYQTSGSSPTTQIRGAGTTYSSPSSIAGGYIAVEGPSNRLYWYFRDDNTGAVDGPLQIGGAGTAWSAPSLVQDQSDNFDIAVQGPSNTLDVYFIIAGTPHGPLQIGVPGSTFSSPN